LTRRSVSLFFVTAALVFPLSLSLSLFLRLFGVPSFVSYLLPSLILIPRLPIGSGLLNLVDGHVASLVAQDPLRTL